MTARLAALPYLSRKLATARSVFRASGVRGLLHAMCSRIRFYRKMQYTDNWWIGRLVELSGDVVSLEGLRFSLAGSAVPTGLKSRVLFDHYEKPEREAVRLLDPTLPVVELGGGLGIVACVTNRLLHNAGRHVVVEANPALLPLLESNRRRNRCQFHIVHGAVAYERATVPFYQRSDFLTGSLQGLRGDPVEVPAITLRSVLADHGFPRCSLVCDIEGGEVDLVRFEGDVLASRVSMLVMETHGRVVGTESTEAMMATLRDLGFEVVSASYGKSWADGVYAFANRADRGVV